MSKRATNNKVGYEPIPGYVLRKRLGAGGYGEVWLADAPGGLQKAIKLIYGTVDESHATSELRSLQRIRQVYHPFLLSLERIEIVGNQVVIITELAESSLLDRFEQYRRKGAPGIPRTMLLDYMRDTADALDFLAQKHSLQHLDVKPGNLLIIADRIKVADFGLIKDLHDQNQSLVSGLTPTYSAPEIFDGRPDYRSDQYSLAIVYMEMLTGQVPFEGRTTGELARQHINQAPNLEALPPADRPVVARALSKNPLDRFATCRVFVEQLLKTRGAVVPVTTQRRTGVKADSDSADTNFAETQQSPVLGGKHVFLEALGIDEIRGQWNNPRTMFIGLGGMGCRALVELRATANRDCDSGRGVEDLNWLAIDTDPRGLNAVTEENKDCPLPASCAIQLPIYKPSEYRNADPELFCPLSRRWLYNIPRSLKTEGVRPLAILALLDHFPQLRSKLLSELTELVRRHNNDEENAEPIRIYVISSLHGGTGSGLLAEIGMLIRRLMSQLHCTNYRLTATVSAATTTNQHSASLQAAAAIASLSELSYLMNRDVEVPSIYHADYQTGTSSIRPFDFVTMVDGGLCGQKSEAENALRCMAKAVWLDAQTMTGAALNEPRTSELDRPHGWLRTIATRPIQITSNISPQNLARWCCEQTLHHALRYMVGPRGIATSSQSAVDISAGNTPTASGDLPLTDNACDDFTRRLLNDLGVVKPYQSMTQVADASQNEALLGQWARRLSNSEELIKAQLAADIAIWKRSIAKTVQMRVYNWKQVEQIQLNVIEGILDYCEHETAALVQLFEPFSSLLGSTDSMLQSGVSYLRRFSEECVKLLQHFQEEGKSMGDRIRSWCESINAEKALNESPWEVNMMGLPPRLQLLASRVNAVLESIVHRLALQALEDSEKLLGLAAAPKRSLDQTENVNLNYMLGLSSDLVSRISNELGMSDEEFTGGPDQETGVSLKQLDQFYPILAESGGNLRRLVIAPTEQLEVVSKALSKRNLRSTTTLIAGTRSLGTHLYCDAGELQLPQLISSLWRPSPATLQLAERLRTRVDIDWEPASQLLESRENLPAATAGDSSPGHPSVSVPIEGGFPPISASAATP